MEHCCLVISSVTEESSQMITWDCPYLYRSLLQFKREEACNKNGSLMYMLSPLALDKSEIDPDSDTKILKAGRFIKFAPQAKFKNIVQFPDRTCSSYNKYSGKDALSIIQDVVGQWSFEATSTVGVFATKYYYRFLFENTEDALMFKLRM